MARSKKKNNPFLVGFVMIGVAVFLLVTFIKENGGFDPFFLLPLSFFVFIGLISIFAGIAKTRVANSVSQSKPSSSTATRPAGTHLITDSGRYVDPAHDLNALAWRQLNEQYHNKGNKRDDSQDCIVCFRCGYINPARSTVCTQCGKDLFAVCPHCKGKNEATALSCHHCGKPLHEEKK